MKSKHAPIVPPESIVVVDQHGQTHIQPAKNRKFVESTNAKLRPDQRSKIFEYDPAHPDMGYYKSKAKGADGKGSTGSNDFAMKKVIEQNDKLQKTADKQAAQLKAQSEQMEEMKKQLAELQKANKVNGSKKETKEPTETA